jgi:hypothetical protein
MDDQYQQLPPGYGSPGETGTVLSSHQNPYALQPPQTQEPVARPQQPGIFDSVPYHSWLAKNVKNPWEASDEDLTGKHFNDYIDGPIKALVKAQLASGHKEISADQLNTRADAIAAGLKLQKQGELNAGLGDLKAHLAGLKGQTPATPPDESFASAVGSGLERSLHTGLGMAATAAAGIPTALAHANPFVDNSEISQSDAAQKWQNYFFGLADKESKNAAAVPNTGTGLLSKIGATVGGLPGAIATLGMNEPLEKARNDIAKGADLDDVKKNLAIDAATNLILSKVPGGTLLTRAGKGAALNPILQNASALLKGDKTPDSVDNLLSAIFGAGFAGALGRRPGEVAKSGEAKPGETQPPSGAPEVDLDALAAKAAGTKGDINTGLSGFKGASLADKIGNADTPEELQAIHDEAIKTVPPEQQQAFTDKFNEVVRGVHADDNAPQVKPLQAQSAPVQGEAVKNEVAPSEVNTGTNAVEARPKPAPEPPNTLVAPGGKPRVRANPLTGRIEPVVKVKGKYNPLTGKVDPISPKYQVVPLPPQGKAKGPKA